MKHPESTYRSQEGSRRVYQGFGRQCPLPANREARYRLRASIVSSVAAVLQSSQAHYELRWYFRLPWQSGLERLIPSRAFMRIFKMPSDLEADTILLLSC